jgi:integrase
VHCKRLIAEFGDKMVGSINPAMVESFKQKRITTISYRGKPTKPATVNRELGTLKTVFNNAVKNGKAERNPVKGVKPFKENNSRDRILSPDEYARLLAHCPEHVRFVVKVAYFTAMRRGGILGLTWGQIDLKEGFIKLRAEDIKTNEGRFVPLNGELVEMLKSMPRGLPMTPVFT